MKKRKKPGQPRIVPVGLTPVEPAQSPPEPVYIVSLGDAPPTPLEAYREAHARYEAILDELDGLWMALGPEDRAALDRELESRDRPKNNRPSSTAAYDTGTARTDLMDAKRDAARRVLALVERERAAPGGHGTATLFDLYQELADAIAMDPAPSPPGGQAETTPDPLPAPPAPPPAPDDLAAFLEGDSDLGALLPSRR